MESGENTQTPGIRIPKANPKQVKRLKIIAAVLTLCGIGLFVYFVATAGVSNVLEGIRAVGWTGFAVLLVAYFLRIASRALAWKLSVHEPYSLRFRDTLPGVIMGEAMSVLIPLGPIISGTTKVLAVRKRVPLLVGFSTITVENMFYAIMTSVLIGGGALAVLKTFTLEGTWIFALYFLIVFNAALITLLIVLTIRQWHLLSESAEILYRHGYMKKSLEHGRMQLRLFENLFFDFYRRHSGRIVPIVLLQVAFHALGIFEVWYVLQKIMETSPTFFESFLLESVNRGVIIIFKLVPFVVGVDEASAQMVAETFAMGAGVGVTLAIIRKGRTLFWTAVGVILIVVRGIHQVEHGERPE